MQWLGFLGMGLVIVAYVPQIVHLVRARCAAGVSLWAYLVWSVSAALLLAYAITTRDPVFIALQAYQLLALTSIYLLLRRHKGQPCDVHCGMPASYERDIAITPGQPIRNLDAPMPMPLVIVAGTSVHSSNFATTTRPRENEQV
jgi:lipid-A-disaccharide synthase-like uncharacterized protein